MGFILYRIRGLYVVRYYPSHTVFSSVGPDPLVTIGTRAFTLAAKRLLEWVCQCRIVKVRPTLWGYDIGGAGCLADARG